MAKRQLHRNHNYCERCRKRIYERKQAAARASIYRRLHRQVVHHYKCPFGNGWHVGHPNKAEDWDRVERRMRGT